MSCPPPSRGSDDKCRYRSSGKVFTWSESVRRVNRVRAPSAKIRAAQQPQFGAGPILGEITWTPANQRFTTSVVDARPQLPNQRPQGENAGVGCTFDFEELFTETLRPGERIPRRSHPEMARDVPSADPLAA